MLSTHFSLSIRLAASLAGPTGPLRTARTRSSREKRDRLTDVHTALALYIIDCLNLTFTHDFRVISCYVRNIFRVMSDRCLTDLVRAMSELRILLELSCCIFEPLTESVNTADDFQVCTGMEQPQSLLRIFLQGAEEIVESANLEVSRILLIAAVNAKLSQWSLLCCTQVMVEAPKAKKTSTEAIQSFSGTFCTVSRRIDAPTQGLRSNNDRMRPKWLPFDVGCMTRCLQEWNGTSTICTESVVVKQIMELSERTLRVHSFVVRD